MSEKKVLGLAGAFMDIDETIYALEELEKNKLGYHSQVVFIAIKYLEKYKKIENIVKGGGLIK